MVSSNTLAWACFVINCNLINVIDFGLDIPALVNSSRRSLLTWGCPPLRFLDHTISFRSCLELVGRMHSSRNTRTSLLYLKLESGDTLRSGGRTLTKCASMPSADLKARWKEMQVINCHWWGWSCQHVNTLQLVLAAWPSPPPINCQ